MNWDGAFIADGSAKMTGERHVQLSLKETKTISKVPESTAAFPGD